MARCRQLSVALLLYTTILWISQVTYDVTADETTSVQDTEPGTSESPNSSTTGDLDRPDDHIQDTTSSAGKSQGFYERYKQFIAKHNKTFTIVFGVLFVISLVVAIGVIGALAQKEQKGYISFVLLFGIIIFGIVICKLCSQNGFTFFRNKKAPVASITADNTG